jgi:hypothetical protein
MLVAAISNRVDCRRRYSSPCTRQFRSIQRFANTVEDGVHSGQIVEASNHPGGPPIAITLIVRQLEDAARALATGVAAAGEDKQTH